MDKATHAVLKRRVQNFRLDKTMDKDFRKMKSRWTVCINQKGKAQIHNKSVMRPDISGLGSSCRDSDGFW